MLMSMSADGISQHVMCSSVDVVIEFMSTSRVYSVSCLAWDQLFVCHVQAWDQLFVSLDHSLRLVIRLAEMSKFRLLVRFSFCSTIVLSDAHSFSCDVSWGSVRFCTTSHKSTLWSGTVLSHHVKVQSCWLGLGQFGILVSPAQEVSSESSLWQGSDYGNLVNLEVSGQKVFSSFVMVRPWLSGPE